MRMEECEEGQGLSALRNKRGETGDIFLSLSLSLSLSQPLGYSEVLHELKSTSKKRNSKQDTSDQPQSTLEDSQTHGNSSNEDTAACSEQEQLLQDQEELTDTQHHHQCGARMDDDNLSTVTLPLGLYPDHYSECSSTLEESFDGDNISSHVMYSGSSTEEEGGGRNHRLPSLVLHPLGDGDDNDVETDSPLTRRANQRHLAEKAGDQEEVSQEQEVAVEEEGEEEEEKEEEKTVWTVANESLRNLYHHCKFVKHFAGRGLAIVCVLYL